MIKFVCASCGERLSVPDQHAGRKGVCPTCQAINRVPPRGLGSATVSTGVKEHSASAQEHSAGAEKHSASAMTATSPARAEPASTHWPSHEPAPAANKIEPSAPHGGSSPAPTAWPSYVINESSAPPSEVPHAFSPAPASAVNWPAASDEPAPVSKQETISAGNWPAYNFDDSSEPVMARKERGFPRVIKIGLLIVAALAIVAALYFALLMALRAVVPGA